MIEQLAEVVKDRGAPEYLRSDNGPEFIARELRAWLAKIGSSTLFIEPGSPWENAYVESFNARLRDELLDMELFTTLQEARYLADRFRWEYNHVRPHSSLNGLAPADFASACGPSGFAPLSLRPRRPKAPQPVRLS